MHLLQRIFNSFNEMYKTQSVHEMTLLSYLANDFGVDKLSFKPGTLFHIKYNLS